MELTISKKSRPLKTAYIELNIYRHVTRLIRDVH